MAYDSRQIRFARRPTLPRIVFANLHRQPRERVVKLKQGLIKKVDLVLVQRKHQRGSQWLEIDSTARTTLRRKPELDGCTMSPQLPLDLQRFCNGFPRA